MGDIENTAATILAGLIVAEKISAAAIKKGPNDLCDLAVDLAHRLHDRCSEIAGDDPPPRAPNG